MLGDDIFGGVEKCEEVSKEKGEEDGYNDGLVLGLDEGRQLGHQKGFEIGQELGFYIGCIKLWKHLSNTGVQTLPERASKHIPMIETLITSFPLDDPQDEEILTILEKVRGKFKVIAQAMGCINAYYNRESASFAF
mmetsp:Transcript_8507/g.16287  ORF Transcript_8507/g.16287 Transcript_8507/m.16287 type:complete len:136 (-) Transcript_8507:144-551(-)